MAGDNYEFEKNNRFFLKDKKYLFVSIILILEILFLSIGFSSFNNNLSVENLSAYVKADRDIGITDIRVDSTSGSTSSYDEYNLAQVDSKMHFDNEYAL